MTTINDIVNVSITRETRSIQRASFAIPCFITSHVQFSDRAKEYNSIDEVTADGFATTSNVYKAASKYFSQEVAVDKSTPYLSEAIICASAICATSSSVNLLLLLLISS